MRASTPPTVALPPLLPFVLAGGLVLGGVLGSGCTSDSPGSTPPDPASPPAETAPVSEADTISSFSSPPPTSTPPDSSRTVAQRLADASVAARIKQALVHERALRPFNFFPEVVKGKVTLRGDVNTREQYRHAERIVETLAEVETVINQITVKGGPVPDKDEASRPSSTSDVEYYTVQRGDTLWEIAREYEISIPQIKALNPYSASPPRPGERLRVR